MSLVYALCSRHWAAKQTSWIDTAKENRMTSPTIVSRDEWLVARQKLLVKEKEATRRAYSQLAMTRSGSIDRRYDRRVYSPQASSRGRPDVIKGSDEEGHQHEISS
jgi:hypothetical protein